MASCWLPSKCAASERRVRTVAATDAKLAVKLFSPVCVLGIWNGAGEAISAERLARSSGRVTRLRRIVDAPEDPGQCQDLPADDVSGKPWGLGRLHDLVPRLLRLDGLPHHVNDSRQIVAEVLELDRASGQPVPAPRPSPRPRTARRSSCRSRAAGPRACS